MGRGRGAGRAHLQEGLGAAVRLLERLRHVVVRREPARQHLGGVQRLLLHELHRLVQRGRLVHVVAAQPQLRLPEVLRQGLRAVLVPVQHVLAAHVHHLHRLAVPGPPALPALRLVPAHAGLLPPPLDDARLPLLLLRVPELDLGALLEAPRRVRRGIAQLRPSRSRAGPLQRRTRRSWRQGRVGQYTAHRGGHYGRQRVRIDYETGAGPPYTAFSPRTVSARWPQMSAFGGSPSDAGVWIRVPWFY